MKTLDIGEGASAAGGPPRGLRWSDLAGVVAGNVLEFYDFTVFAFFASQIGRSMFASGKGTDGLLLALGTFAVGFLARPVGAAVIGRYADRVGRKPAMVLSFSLMGASLIVTALTPPSSVLGVWSAVIISLTRLLQGFAIGGEIGPSMAVLIEAAPTNRRGTYGAWQNASQGLAILMAGLVGLTISLLLSPQAVIAWGWRLALLIGAAVLPVGLRLRSRMPETLEAQGSAPLQPDVSTLPLPRLLVMGLLLVLSGTLTAYTLQFVNTFCVSILKLTATLAFSTTVVTGATLFLFGLVGGRLSDRYGRRAVIVLPRVLLLIVVYPLFARVIAHPTLLMLAFAVFVITALFACSTAAANVALAEGLPRARRSTSYAVTYTLAVAIFGGSAQLLIAWMTKATGNHMVPAWWLIGATVTGVAAGLFMPVRQLQGAPSIAGARPAPVSTRT